MSYDFFNYFILPSIFGLAVAATSAQGENRAFVMQNGWSNQATTVQEGRQNVAITAQRGSFNAASIDQSGRDNVAAIVQSGAGLDASIEQTGIRQSEVVFQADTFGRAREGSVFQGDARTSTTIRFELVRPDQ